MQRTQLTLLWLLCRRAQVLRCQLPQPAALHGCERCRALDRAAARQQVPQAQHRIGLGTAELKPKRVVRGGGARGAGVQHRALQQPAIQLDATLFPQRAPRDGVGWRASSFPPQGFLTLERLCWSVESRSQLSGSPGCHVGVGSGCF